jgi:transcriptional regulator with XRE-family HTH domain
MEKETIADRLNKAMKLSGHSQASLAEAAGISQPSVWKILNGSTKKPKNILELSLALGVRAEWLSKGELPMRSGPGDDDGKVRRFYYDDVFPATMWSESGPTDSIAIIPNSVKSPDVRAYRITNNTGCAEVPAGSLIAVDPAVTPGTNDLVYAKVGRTESVYRFLMGGEAGFLSVDDSRVPVIPIGDNAELIGVIVYLARNLRR